RGEARRARRHRPQAHAAGHRAGRAVLRAHLHAHGGPGLQQRVPSARRRPQAHLSLGPGARGGMIELEDVSLDYAARGRSTRALQDITLTVARGASVAFVGPSGCGKSTLLKLISGLLPATSGTVRVDGRTVTAPLKNVGMAFQNPVLLPWRRVLDNVMLPLDIFRENRAK